MVRHLKDGEDFNASHFAETGFGFSGSAQGGKSAKPPHAADRDTHGPKHEADPAEQGHDFAHGGHIHPHGHKVVGVDPPTEDGRVVMHHAHGGQSVHHRDGRVTHHHHDGAPVAQAMGGIENMHDSSEYAHRHKGSAGGSEEPMPAEPDEGGAFAKGGHHKGGDEAQDRKLFGKMMAEHEKGEGEDGMASGGFARMRPRLGRGMRPKAETMHSPINTPPRNPQTSPSPRNAMPGGAMGYGVQPSAEPDQAGADQTGMAQLRKGGRKG